MRYHGFTITGDHLFQLVFLLVSVVKLDALFAGLVGEVRGDAGKIFWELEVKFDEDFAL